VWTQTRTSDLIKGQFGGFGNTGEERKTPEEKLSENIGEN